MAYGLRFRTTSVQIGTSCDFYLPTGDMPSDQNERGYEIFEDQLTSVAGNTWLYAKGRRKIWALTFEDISTRSKEFMEHIAGGWFDKQQVTIVYFGTSVIGTTETPGSMATAGQLWGTGFVRFTSKPRETAFDLWSFDIFITEFGTNQSF